MPTKPYLRNSLLVIALFMVLLLTGCFDLGSFDSDADYCNSFSKVTVYENYKATSYDFEDFYSSESVNDLISVLDYGYYQAISFQVERDMLIEDFYMYFQALENSSITMNLFITNSGIAIKKDDDDNEEIEDLDNDLMVDSTYASLSTEYDSVGFNDGDYEVSEDQFIIITFKENLVKDELKNVSFRFANILIRGIF